MTMAEESMAKSLRKIANVLESEEVQPRILREVEILIRKFPTAEALTSLKTTSPITKCPPEILEEILEYPNSKDLKSTVLVNKKLCVIGCKPWFWSKSKVSLQSLDAGVTSEREVRYWSLRS